MQWKGRRESDNVDDRRGSGGGRVAFGGGIGIIIIIVGLFFGKDLTGLVSQIPSATLQTTQSPINDEDYIEVCETIIKHIEHDFYGQIEYCKKMCE